MSHIATIALFVGVALGTSKAEKREKYNFRKSEECKQLFKENRDKQEQVHRDLTMFWGVLDRYCDDHDGNPPKKIEELTPVYLAELPSDPFTTKETQMEKLKVNTPSKDGDIDIGSGAMFMSPGIDTRRSWVLASVGLPEFPYNAARNNIGLYTAKGIWL